MLEDATILNENERLSQMNLLGKNTNRKAKQRL